MSNPMYGYGAAPAVDPSAMYSSYEIDRIAARYSAPTSYAAADKRIGVTRSLEALYHQPLLGNQTTIGPTEALYASNPMVKRPRLEGSLPVYPQRPGEKDCAFYMTTRTCKFGDSCKFDHPIWVPEGGIPDWKEVPLVVSEESYPERPGEPDCPYFMKTNKCKFGSKCKFNHPKGKVNIAGETGQEGTDIANIWVLPERPSEPLCAFYARTGTCKFGSNCKFNHPKDLQIPSSGKEADSTAKPEATADSGAGNGVPAKTFTPYTTALLHNSKGLPIRPGEADCPFYMKTGSCKYGATCRYNHPERNAINPLLAPTVPQTFLPPAPPDFSVGLLNPATGLLPNIDLQSAHAPFGVAPTTIYHPRRPGEAPCDFYMKTGQCKFGETCKYDHPVDRTTASVVDAKSVQPPVVKLTLAGLPRREDAEVCAFYMKTGTCKFGPSCKFDHPPPGEAVAKATMQGAGATEGA